MPVSRSRILKRIKSILYTFASGVHRYPVNIRKYKLVINYLRHYKYYYKLPSVILGRDNTSSGDITVFLRTTCSAVCSATPKEKKSNVKYLVVYIHKYIFVFL